MGDRTVQMVIDEATGQFQLFVDGVQLSDEEAVAETRRILADANAVLGGGGVVMESGIEFHKNPNAQHIHLTNTQTHRR